MQPDGPPDRGIPQVHDLAAMLQCQEKSIVSRVLVKSAGRSVTLRG